MSVPNLMKRIGQAMDPTRPRAATYLRVGTKEQAEERPTFQRPDFKRPTFERPTFGKGKR
jgi:hypothetical protein